MKNISVIFVIVLLCTSSTFGQLVGIGIGPPYVLDTRVGFLDLGVAGGQINRTPSGEGTYSLEFDVVRSLALIT